MFINKVLYILLFLFSANCVSVISHTGYMTKQGFYVELRGNDVKQEEIELAIDIVTETLSFRYPRIYSKKKIKKVFDESNYVIEVHNKIISCPTSRNPTRTCQGFHSSMFSKIRYVHHNRISITSVVHEIIHMLNWHIEGIVDHKHVNKKFFKRACLNKKEKSFCELRSLEGFVNSLLREIENQ